MKGNELDLHLSAAKFQFLITRFNSSTFWLESSSITTCRTNYEPRLLFGKKACVEKPLSHCPSTRMLTTEGCDAICSESLNDACIQFNYVMCEEASEHGECHQDSEGCTWLCVNGLYDQNRTTLKLGQLVNQRDHQLLFDQIQGFKLPSQVRSISISPTLRTGSQSTIRLFNDSWVAEKGIQVMYV